MKVIEIIKELRSQGFVIEAYKRKDGGYLIKSINGVKYEAAKGNEAARAMVNASLSPRREKQLRSITPKAKTKAAKIRKAPKPKKPALPEDMKKQIRDLQKLFRENVSELGKYTTVKTKSIRNIIENEGEEAARKALEKAQKYGEGYAYVENVKAVLERLKKTIEHTKLKKVKEILQEIYDKINENKQTMKQEWMNDIVNDLYDWDNGLKTIQNATELRDKIFRMMNT